MNELPTHVDKLGADEHCHSQQMNSPTVSTSSSSSENAGNTNRNSKDRRLKSSQCRVLAWVAVARNNNRQIPPEQRCICPMAGCWQQFQSPKEMHMHLKDSICISRDTYYCFEAERWVRVGRCYCEGCEELKSRLASAVSSSIQSLKRRLSSRSSRSPRRASGMIEMEPTFPDDGTMDLVDPDKIKQHSGISISDYAPVVVEAASSEILEAANSELFELNSASFPYVQSSHLGQHPSQTSAHQSEIYSSGPYELEQQGCTASDMVYGGYHDTCGYEKLSRQRNREMQFSPEDSSMIHGQVSWRCAPSAGFLYDHTSVHQDESMWEHPPSSLGNPSLAARPDSGRTEAYEMSFSPSYQYQGQSSNNTAAIAYAGLQYSDQMLSGDTSDLSLDGRLWASPKSNGASFSSSSSHFPDSLMSSGSSAWTGRTSITSHNSINTGYETGKSFLIDDGAIVEEPKEMESSPIPNPHKRRKYRNVRANARGVDTAGVNIDNSDQFSYDLSSNHIVPMQTRSTSLSRSSEPPFYTSGPLNGKYVNSPPQISVIPSLSSYPSTTVQTPPNLKEISPGKAQCRYCDSPCDMSNRSRHEKSCKRNPDSASAPRIPCQYPGCLSTFTRNDNLAHHQRAQKHHVTIGNVELKFSLTPTPGSAVWDLAMQALGQNCGATPVERQGDERGMRYEQDDVL